jgi:hypothetical protein
VSAPLLALANNRERLAQIRPQSLRFTGKAWSQLVHFMEYGSSPCARLNAILGSSTCSAHQEKDVQYSADHLRRNNWIGLLGSVKKEVLFLRGPWALRA